MRSATMRIRRWLAIAFGLLTIGIITFHVAMNWGSPSRDWLLEYALLVFSSHFVFAFLLGNTMILPSGAIPATDKAEDRVLRPIVTLVGLGFYIWLVFRLFAND